MHKIVRLNKKSTNIVIMNSTRNTRFKRVMQQSIQNSVLITSPKDVSLEKNDFDFVLWDLNYSENNVTYNTKPVYIEIDETGEELLAYHPKRMLVNKLYEVNWKGNTILYLRKKANRTLLENYRNANNWHSS